LGGGKWGKKAEVGNVKKGGAKNQLMCEGRNFRRGGHSQSREDPIRYPMLRYWASLTKLRVGDTGSGGRNKRIPQDNPQKKVL